MTTALEGGEGSASRPGRSLPPGKTRCPLYRRVGGPQGRSGQVRKISTPLGFNPQTVQPVASRYTDYVTRPTLAPILSQINPVSILPTQFFKTHFNIISPSMSMSHTYSLTSSPFITVLYALSFSTDSLRAGGPDFENQWETKLSISVQTGPKAHPASCTKNTRCASRG